MRRLLLLFFLINSFLPAHAAKQVTVEQLEHTLTDARGRRDQDLAKQLGSMQLSERLSSPRLAKAEMGLPGEKSRLALLALADASVFLQLPAAEIPATANPDAAAQKLILSRAAEYLAGYIPKLPDFFARQTTIRFHDLKVSYFSGASDPVIVEHQAFQPLDTFIDTISYANGHEVEESNEKQPGSRRRDGLVNWGVFGQLQNIVVTDIYKGKMEWGHWELLPSGPVAVFQYSIPKENSSYIVKYCCIGSMPASNGGILIPATGGKPNFTPRFFESVPAFHGEIAIDSATGAVHRLVLRTDLSPSDPIFQAEIMVEYAQVEIGGKTYICPSKSVTITSAFAPVLRVGSCVNSECVPSHVLTPKDTAINDVEYDSYHVFRSEIRILPSGSTGQPNIPVSVPSAAPGP